MQGAKGVIVSITGGEDMRLMEVDEAANHIRELVDPDANIIWGSAFNENLNGKIRVSVVATGIDNDGSAASPSAHATRPFAFSRPAETVAEPEATISETAAFAAEPEAEIVLEAPSDVSANGDDDSLELGSEHVADAETEATASAPEDEGADDSDDLLELGEAQVEASDDVAPEYVPAADVSPAPDRPAPRVSTGGTLFERMSNLSRGLSRSDEEEDTNKDAGAAGGLNIPRFLDRQSNN